MKKKKMKKKGRRNPSCHYDITHFRMLFGNPVFKGAINFVTLYIRETLLPPLKCLMQTFKSSCSASQFSLVYHAENWMLDQLHFSPSNAVWIQWKFNRCIPVHKMVLSQLNCIWSQWLVWFLFFLEASTCDCEILHE